MGAAHAPTPAMDLPLLTPDWPAPAGVHAACSTRLGGVSSGGFESLNLGDHVGDDAIAVARNRQRYAQALGAHPVFMHQVHGWDAVLLDAHTLQGVTADACLATEVGLACTVMVADCLPVLLARRDGAAVAAAHAGWRGLAGRDGRGVLEVAVEHLRHAGHVSTQYHALKTGALDSPRSHEAPHDDVIAWLGPCIGPRAFEVGPEVHAVFTGADPGSETCFAATGQGKFLADLAGLARQRLADLGVTAVHGNDGSLPWCTVNNRSRFFSHRRDRGVSGRFAASVWLA